MFRRRSSKIPYPSILRAELERNLSEAKAELSSLLRIIKTLLGQFEDHHGLVGANLKFLAVGFRMAVLKAQMEHNLRRGGVVKEAIAPESREMLVFKTVAHNLAQSLCADAAVPEWTCHPVAYLNLVRGYVKIAYLGREVSHTTYRLIISAKGDGSHIFVAENGVDNGAALLDTLVRRPASTRSHLGVGGIAIKAFSIIRTPRTEN